MHRLNIFLEHIYEGAAQQDISLSQMLAEAHSAGCTGLECDLWRLENRKEMSAVFSENQMTAASVYNMYDFVNTPLNKSTEKIKHHLDTAAYFGAKTVLAIPGFIRESDNEECALHSMYAALDRMCGEAKQYGITVTLEDFDDLYSPCRNTEGLLMFMKNVPDLRVTFDTGNFAYVLENTAEAYDALKPYIAHVHLKDRSFDSKRADKDKTNHKADISGRLMYPCEAGDGYCGLADIVKRLIADGYSGSFSIEHFGAADQLSYMKRSAENIRKLLKKGE